jgi:hypothetical protein
VQGCCVHGGETVGEVMVAGLEVTPRCPVFVCQGERGGAMAGCCRRGPAIACCAGDPAGQRRGGAGPGQAARGEGGAAWGRGRKGVAVRHGLAAGGRRTVGKKGKRKRRKGKRKRRKENGK